MAEAKVIKTNQIAAYDEVNWRSMLACIAKPLGTMYLANPALLWISGGHLELNELVVLL